MVTLLSAKDHRLVDVNEAFERLSGYSRTEMIGRTALELGTWEDLHQLRELSRRMVSKGGKVQNMECRYRELHDDISQKLALLAIELQQMDEELPALEQSMRRHIGKLWQQTNNVASDVQHLLHQLHSSKLQHLGLTVDARSLCEEFARQHRVTVEFTVRDMPKAVDEELALCLFRVLQELLHSVAKHSGAARVSAEFAGEEGRILLQVSDDGTGFDPASDESWHGLGLFSMQERLSLVGGLLSIQSKPLQGTRIEAVVPISVEENPPPGTLLSDPAAAGVI